jgi:hypothetical protein
VVRLLALALAVVGLAAAGCSTSSNTYYYCWDDPSQGGPHHLGHPVSGDHLCSDDELHKAGISGY